MAAESTSASGLAGRYAAALFELADGQKSLDPVAEDLRALKGVLADSDDLMGFIRSPVHPRSEQSKAMAAILDKAGTGELARRFVLTVAQNRRLFALPQMIDAYLAELAQRRGEVTAEVVAAAPLTKAQETALGQVLKKEYGDKVQMDIKIDEGLIGGLTIRVGSRLVDGSLRSKLHKLELAMKRVD